MNYDEMLGRIDQKLDDLKQQFVEHTAQSKAAHTDFHNRIKVIEILKLSVDRPIRWIGWTVTLILSGILLYWGDRIGHWLTHTFRH